MLPQQRKVVLLGIVSVGHVGLVAEVDKFLPVEIGGPVAIGIRGVAVVVKAVEADDGVEDGEPTGAGVEHPDRQGAVTLRVGGGIDVKKALRLRKHDIANIAPDGRNGGAFLQVGTTGQTEKSCDKDDFFDHFTPSIECTGVSQSERMPKLLPSQRGSSSRRTTGHESRCDCSS